MWVNLDKNSFSNCTHIVMVYTLQYWQGVIFYIKNIFVKRNIHCYLIKFYEINSLYLYYQFANNYNYSHLIQSKNVSSPEDIILSEHVEESLPRELCDIPWQFVVTVITCDTFLFTMAGLKEPIAPPFHKMLLCKNQWYI